MKIRQRIRCRSGWMLIEILLVIVCLSILLSLLGSLVWAIFRIQNASVDSFLVLQRESRFADLFRDDVARSVDVPEWSGDYEASPVCLVLKGDGLTILYRFLDGRLERLELGDRDPVVESFPVPRAEFRRAGRYVEMSVFGPKRGRLTIGAALGGNDQ